MHGRNSFRRTGAQIASGLLFAFALSGRGAPIRWDPPDALLVERILAAQETARSGPAAENGTSGKLRINADFGPCRFTDMPPAGSLTFYSPAATEPIPCWWFSTEASATGQLSTPAEPWFVSGGRQSNWAFSSAPMSLQAEIWSRDASMAPVGQLIAAESLGTHALPIPPPGDMTPAEFDAEETPMMGDTGLATGVTAILAAGLLAILVAHALRSRNAA